MDDRDIEEPKDWDPRISMDVIRNILKDPPPPLVGDICCWLPQNTGTGAVIDHG